MTPPIHDSKDRTSPVRAAADIDSQTPSHNVEREQIEMAVSQDEPVAKKPDIVEEAQQDVTVGSIQPWQVSAELQRSITWKLDLRLLPLLSLMYLFNAIDRGNLGNAKTDGLDKDLGLKGDEYRNTLVLFYITFCLFDLPSNLLLKRYSGKIMLPLLMFGWGSMTLIQCGVHNWGDLLACRLLMGMFEAGFFAGVTFYLTLFYRRNEIAFRMSIFYGSATVAGAFSGLLSFGVFQIKDKHIPGWKYLFLIEGCATLLLATFSFWHLPRSASTCKWFTAEEKVCAKQRLMLDGSMEVDEKFNLKEAVKGIFNVKIFVWAAVAFSYGVATASVGNFLPQMVQRLGYSVIKTNIYTVAPYAVGTVVLLCLCRSSDYFRERSIHLCIAMLLTLVGYIILMSVNVREHHAIGYFACFMLCSGAFAPSCLFHSWHTNNSPSEGQRAAITGFLVGANNSAGIVSSLSFTAKSAPVYLPALIVTGTFQVIGIIIVLSMGTYLRWDNNQRDKDQGIVMRARDMATENLVGGTKDPSWRWTP